MKWEWQYGTAVVTLPMAVLDKLDRATKKEIKVLLTLAADASLLAGTDKALCTLAERAGISEAEVAEALSFWRGAGVLAGGETTGAVTPALHSPKTEAEAPREAAKPAKEPTDTTRLKVHSDSLPRYNTDEMTALLEKRQDMKTLIDECQRAFGKIFNTGEINILVGLVDYLGLTGEYLLLLMTYCGKQEHKSIRQVEKLAIRLMDEEVTEPDALEERLRYLEEAHMAEGQIRKTFGLTARALTGKEKKLIHKWIAEYHFDYPVIEKAYEVTVDSTQKPSLPYAGAILDRWYAEGLRTLADVEKDLEKPRENKGTEGGSFDTDAFLEAAIRHSFGEQ